MILSSKYKMQKNFVIDLLGCENIQRGSKYGTIFWPPGQVEIAFGSVKIKAL